MSASFYSNCGVYLVRMGSHERAMQLFQKAKKVTGGECHIPLLVNILLCSFRLLKYDTCLLCLDDIEKLLELTGNDFINESDVRRVRAAVYTITNSRIEEKSIPPPETPPPAPLLIDTVHLSSIGVTNIPRSHSFTSRLKSPDKTKMPKPSRIPTMSTPNTYPYERLSSPQKQGYPRDVNIVEREKHLSDEEFLKLFGMTKNAFSTLPEWRRVEKKREHKLF